MGGHHVDDWFMREVLPLEGVLTRFLQRHWRQSADIADLRQETYARAYEAALRKRPERIKPFLLQIARNLMIDQVRRQSVVSLETMADFDWPNVSDDGPSLERHITARQQLRLLQEALDELPPRCRQIVVMRKVDGLSQKEVAARMGCRAMCGEIKSGGMNVAGGPTVLHDMGAVLAWDGRKLSGPWLVLRAMDAAIERAEKFGMGAVTIQRSHHLASLGAYLKRATDRGYLMLLTLTDAGHSSVAPFGGVTPVLTSNPIAFGAPTDSVPLLMDTTTSLQSNDMVALYKEQGRPLPAADLMDANGNATTDPSVIGAEPPGTILPLGGIKDGNKGAAISLMVEFLTGCLSGGGRAEPFEG